MTPQHMSGTHGPNFTVPSHGIMIESDTEQKYISKQSRFDNDPSEIDNFDVVDFNNDCYFWAQPP